MDSPKRSRHLRTTAMIAGAAMAALLFFIGGMALRLLIGPISLGPFAGAIEDSLNSTVRGLYVRFDQAVLEWSRENGKVNLIILGTKVFDRSGRIIAQAPKADLDFDVASLMEGDFALKRFALVGVQLTAVRNAGGTLKLGVGPTPSDADLLQIIRDTLRENADTGGSLDTFAVRNSRLAYRDVPTGLFLISPEFGLTVDMKSASMDAALDAAIEISGSPASLNARFVLREDGSAERGRVSLKGVRLASFAANSHEFSMLAPFALTSDFDAEFVVDAAGRLANVEFTAGGAGTIATLQEGAPPVAVEKFAAQGSYDGGASRLTVSSLRISGKEVSGTGRAVANFTWNGGDVSSAEISADFDELSFAAPGLFSNAVRFDRIAFRGKYDEADRLTVSRILVNGSRFGLDISGAADFSGPGTPAITATGSMAAMPVRDLVRYWPIGVGEGGRQWVAANMTDGAMGPAAIAVNIPAGALDEAALPESALSVTFPMNNVTANYIKGLTPLTRANGHAALSGNTFRGTITDGAVGPLAVRGDVAIPNLHIPAAPGDFNVHVEGAVFDVLELMNQEPLGYPKRFGIDPATASGRASLDLAFKVPMLKNLSVEDVGIGIAARVTDMGIAIDKKRRLERTNANFTIDAKQLTATGSASLSGVPLNFIWNEIFANQPVTTTITAQGRVDEAGRAALGLGAMEFLTGPADISMTMTGKRFRFEGATINADLAPTTIDFATFNLQKRGGVPATLAASIRFLPAGAMAIPSLSLKSQGLSLDGNLAFDAEGTITSASFPIVKTGANDFQLVVQSAPGATRTMRVTGASFDASRLFSGSTAKTPVPAQAATPWPEKPLTLDARVRRVMLRDKLTLNEVAVVLSFGPNQHLSNFSLSAIGPAAKAQVSGKLEGGTGARVLTLTANDAGGFIEGLTGVGSIRGGSMTARAEFPAVADPNVDYRGTLLVTDVVLVDQPFLARFFSAGSLDGPARLLGNQGIVVSKLEAPFHARGHVITVGEGRASGPAIGVSFKGMIDRSADTLDLSGTLVPLYGLNSMLGAVPLLGDILVSKPGEGIFGLTYRVHGDIGEPQTNINPLSALTPGIFRRIFEYDPPEPAPQAQAVPAPSPTPTIPPGQTPPPAPQAR